MIFRDDLPKPLFICAVFSRASAAFYFYDVTNLLSFDEAICAAFPYLAGYERLFTAFRPRKHSGGLTCPLVQSEKWIKSTVNEQLRIGSLMGVSYVAYLLEGKPLGEAEREKLCEQVMPEFGALLREAERLALRMVHMRALFSARVNKNNNC